MPVPSYVVIDPAVTGPEARPWKWLGKFTQLMERPTENYAPFTTDIQPILSPYFLSPSKDVDSNIIIKATKDTGLQLKLFGIFSTNSSSNQEKNIQLQSPRIVTFSLQQHQKAFEAALNHPSTKDEIHQLLTQSKGQAYFVVGVKICYDAIVSYQITNGASHNPKLTIPAVEAAAIALQMPLTSVPEGINPEIGWNTGGKDEHTLKYAFQGPRIFAMEFRKVKLNKSFLDSRKTKPQISNQIPRFNSRTDVFGDRKSQSPARQKLQDSSKVSDINQGSTSTTETRELQLATKEIQVLDLDDGLGWATSRVDDAEDQFVLLHKIGDEQ